MLKKWKDTEEERILYFMLGFFKQLCKAYHKIHVVFATYDSTIDRWLDSRKFQV